MPPLSISREKPTSCKKLVGFFYATVLLKRRYIRSNFLVSRWSLVNGHSLRTHYSKLKTRYDNIR